MRRVPLILSAGLVAVALAVPAGSHAAKPSKGEWWNHSQKSGLYMVTTHHTIKALWLFCKTKYDPLHSEFAEARYQLRDEIHVHGDGTFSYRGKADRYGPSSQPLGPYEVRLNGRFTSSRRVKIKRTLSKCGPTLTATAER